MRIRRRLSEQLEEVNKLQDKTQRRLLSRTLSDYLLYFPALTVSGLMGLVTVAVLSKCFSPAEYGHYTLAFSTLLLLSTVTGLWLRSSVLRLLPQYTASNRVSEFLGTFLGAGTFFSVAVVLLYSLALPLLKSSLDEQLYRLLWLVVPGVPILTIFTVLQESHRIQGRSALYSGLILLRVLGGFLVGLLLAVPLGWGPAGMLLGLIIVIAGAIGGHVVLASRRLSMKTQALHWSGSVLRDMLTYTLPIVGLNLASTVLAVSDRYLIEAYLSSSDLGIYAVSYTIAEGGLRLIANTFMTVVNPIAFTTWEAQGPAIVYRFLERMVRYYVLLSLPALVGLSVLSHKLIAILSSPAFAAGASAMVFVGVAIFFHGGTLLVNVIFDSTKRTTIPLANFVIAGGVNVLMNLLLLPRFGYMAAAWTTTASYALLFVLTVRSSRRFTNLQLTGGYLPKTLFASAGMGGLIYLLQQCLPTSLFSLCLLVLTAIVVYVLLLLTVKGLEEEEILSIKHRARDILTRVLGMLAHHRVEEVG